MPQYSGFIYGSNEPQSPWADCERTVNWYPEPTQASSSPHLAALYPCPGQQEYTTVADINGRALFAMADRCFAVIGPSVYKVLDTNSASIVTDGTVTNDPNPASIASNGDAGGQLLIGSGTNAYLLTIATNTLSASISALSGKCTMVGMIDGYFLSFDSDESKFYISALNNGASWDATQYAQRSIAPDPWKAMVVDGNRQIWLIGEQTGEVWYDAGTSPFPFAPVPGSVFSYGTSAPYSVKLAGDKMVWLSQTADGAGIVVAATGLVPQRVSSYAVETAIAGYARTSTITDAEAVVYSDQGHTFYCLTFPSAEATWVFDLSTGLWHERGVWDVSSGSYSYWGPRSHCYAFGQHLVTDRTTGLICTMDTAFTTECNGDLIRRLRVPPPLWLQAGASRRLFVSRLELLLEPGLGTASGQGVNPQVMMRTSTDLKTWSNTQLAAAGAQGNFGTRVYWTRLASSDRVWVPEVTVSDPIPWRIVGADVEGRNIQGRDA
jgi:hypothetical protein